MACLSGGVGRIKPTNRMRPREGPLRIDYPRHAYSGWRRFVPSWRQWLSVFLAGVVLACSGFIALYILIDVPAPNDLSQAQASVVYYDNGKDELGRFAEVDRTLVTLHDVPSDVQHAVLAAEDRGFYENSGISPSGIARAAWNNIIGGDLQGASTITQQYARNAYLSQERTWTRKIKETILAIKLNRELSKDQILEDYLNTIYFGRGAYGIQAASQAYFRKDVQQLSVEEGAVLAAVIRSPASYDPAEGRSEKEALEGRVLNYVIPGMVEQDWLGASDAAKLKVPKVPKPEDDNQYAGQNGYLLFYVRDELRELGFNAQEIDGGGLRVTTTFNEQAQVAAEQSVEEGFPPPPNDRVQTGLASVEPGTGRIMAMYGGFDYLKSQTNNAITLQQPGSTLKAFTLAAALEEGVTLTDTFAGNSPFYVEGTANPFNNEFDQSYGDQVSLLTALKESINTAFVDLSVQIGPEKVIDVMEATGIPKDAPGLLASPSLTLGFSSVTPLQMAAAYATFAAQGEYAPPFSVEEVRSSSGALLYSADPKPRQVIAPGVANEVTYGLTQVVASGTGTNALALDRPAAGKTGTSADKTAWFVGYTPQLSTAVLFFREGKNGEELSLDGVGGLSTFFGGEYPTLIWTAYMAAALAGQPVEQFPEPPAPVVTFTPTPTPTPSPTTESPSPTPSPTTKSPKPTKSPTPTQSTTPTTSSASPSAEEQAAGAAGGGNGRRAAR